MSPPAESFELRCMHTADESAAGGVATVHWLGEQDSVTVVATAGAYFDRGTVPAQVQVFLATNGDDVIVESFYATGARIRFCGHGALAAAFVAFDKLQASAAPGNFSNAERRWTARQTDTGIALDYDCPAVAACTVPEFAAAALGAEPVAAATAGGPNDYWIIRLSDAAAVAALQPDFAAVTAATERAVIVTAPSEDADHPGCVFRYFAPQYGMPEDMATGSAAVQLAPYWQPEFSAAGFSARQLSASGARMRLRCYDGKVELAARVGYA